jgi:DNA-binding CsgD family transcriptional regulator
MAHIDPRPPADLALESNLSPRQTDCLALLKAGHKSKTIARELGISFNTVNQHIKAIFRRLGVDTRAEAVAKAMRLDLI